MATSKDVVCGVCDALHVTKSAANWCPECQEGLCSDCQRYHMVSKASRDHEVISIESYKKLPPTILEIVKFCGDHEYDYTNFCQEHNAPCCPGCISSLHKNCLGRMVLLQEIVKTSKSSSTLHNIEQCCNDLKENIDKVEENRKQNLSQIQEQRQKILSEIKQLRIQINSQLDKLENDAIDKLLAAETKIKSKIEPLLSQLSEESKNVDLLHRHILDIKEHASDLQTFLCIKTIEKTLEKNEQSLKSLVENLQQQNITFRINDSIKKKLANIKTFGLVSIDTGPSSVNLTTKKEKQSQMIAAM